MKKWLAYFYKLEDAIITINDKQYKVSDCELVSKGSYKKVFRIKDTNLCFFIPNQWSDDIDWCPDVEQWDRSIISEKSLLDEMDSLGLKTQRFDIVPAMIGDDETPKKRAPVMNILLAKNFQHLCEEESLAIYDVKGGKTFGNPPNFVAMRENFKDKEFVQKIFQKIIYEYALAAAFSLPITILQNLDDSEHYCFELSKDPTEPPVARYMFWDVTADFTGVKLPVLPTLNRLKEGRPIHYLGGIEETYKGIMSLASLVAVAMDALNDLPWNSTFIQEVKHEFLAAINDEIFLNGALVKARQEAIKYLNNYLIKISEKNEDFTTDEFISLMKSVISTGDMELLNRSFNLSQAKDLQKPIDMLVEFAKQYENNDIVIYLEKEKLLNASKAISDSGYSFFKARELSSSKTIKNEIENPSNADFFMN